MELKCNDDMWRRIWFNICQDYGFMASKREAELYLLSLGIIVDKDPGDGRWHGVKINLEDEELTIFLLKWAHETASLRR